MWIGLFLVLAMIFVPIVAIYIASRVMGDEKVREESGQREEGDKKKGCGGGVELACERGDRWRYLASDGNYSIIHKLTLAF